MKEFRRLACCLGVSRPRRYNGSGSSSNFAQNVVGVGGGGGTHSNRSARSIGSFKAATIGFSLNITGESLSYHISNPLLQLSK